MFDSCNFSPVKRVVGRGGEEESSFWQNRYQIFFFPCILHSFQDILCSKKSQTGTCFIFERHLHYEFSTLGCLPGRILRSGQQCADRSLKWGVGGKDEQIISFTKNSNNIRFKTRTCIVIVTRHSVFYVPGRLRARNFAFVYVVIVNNKRENAVSTFTSCCRIWHDLFKITNRQ